MSVAEWMKREHEQIILGFQVSWMGIRILKNPLDCWIYQELIWKVRPEVVVEIGSYQGGITMFFCHLFDMMGQGQVISLDIDRSSYQAKHSRITDITGDCSDPAIVDEVTQLCAGKKVMIIHDGDHAQKAVLRDLRLYADMVSVESYFVVEDGIVDVFDAAFAPTFGNNAPGPLPAIREFLQGDTRFTVDKDCERYLITHNPSGFLKRVRA